MASTVETTAVALRGGNHDASLNFTGISKELVADMGSTGDGTDATTTTLRLHNGITSGGIPMMRADTMNMSTRVLAEGRGKIGDKNVAYADLANFSDTTDTSDTNLAVRENIIKILTNSDNWTATNLLLTTKAQVINEINSAKSWVNSHFVAQNNPGESFVHTENTINIPTTFTSSITASGDNTFSGTNNFSGAITVPNKSVSTNTKAAANTAFVHSVVNDLSDTVVHLSGTETVTGDKTFTGAVDLTGATTTVATAASGTANNTVASTQFVANAITGSQQYFVTTNTTQNITGVKHFTSADIWFDNPNDPQPGDYSPIASVGYVDAAFDNFSEDMVLTTGIDNSDPLQPSIAAEQHIYCSKTFDATNGQEIADLEAAIPQDDPQRAQKIAALEALRHDNTVTFGAGISSSGVNSWTNTNTFTTQLNTRDFTATGLVHLNGRSTAVTPSSMNPTTDIATTEWVTQFGVKVQPVVSKFADALNGAVTLAYNTKIYRVTGTVSNFSFNISNLGTLANDDAIEFKLFIPSTTDASNANWPASVRFLNEQAPTLATNRNYVITLFSIDKGLTWWLAMSGWNYGLWG